MYNKTKIFAAFVFSLALILTGCKSNNSPVTPFGSTSSSNLLMKVVPYHSAAINTQAVKVKNMGTQVYIQFPITGGTVDVQNAYVNFKNLVVEENSGFDGQQTGENGTGGTDGTGDTGGTESNSPNITAPGPFSIDIASGSASLGNFSVYPGTFKKVDFQLTPNSASPYFGNTIVISGTYTPTSGTAIPFTLKSGLAAQLQLHIANGGITVTTNSSVAINIVIDLPGLFNQINFSSATITNGQILIDNQNNNLLLSVFQAALNTDTDVEEGHSGSD